MMHHEYMNMSLDTGQQCPVSNGLLGLLPSPGPAGNVQACGHTVSELDLSP